MWQYLEDFQHLRRGPLLYKTESVGWHQADLVRGLLYYVLAETLGKSLKLSILRFFVCKMGNLPKVPLRTEYDDICKCLTHAGYCTGPSSLPFPPKEQISSVGLCWALRNEGLSPNKIHLVEPPLTPTFSHPHPDPSTRLGTQVVFRSSLKAC